MIIGIGVDIIEITRIAAVIERVEDQFLKRVFTEAEIANAPIDSAKLIAYYAKRFAAKEALSKALGCGIGATLSFQDVEVLNNPKGAPFFNRPTKEGYTYHLSLSDTAGLAVAYVVVESQ
jgi:holo-[acyl-carrier protein] synthase